MASDQWRARNAQLCCLRLAVVAACLGSQLGVAAIGVGSKIYWSDAGKNSIRRCNLDGSDVEEVIHTGNGTQPHGLAIDQEGGKLYWCAFGTREIRRASLDGTDAETLLTTYRNPEGLAVDRTRSKLYWTDVEGRIQRAGLDGDAPEGLAQAVFVSRNGIATDGYGEKIFWPEEEDRASIYQSNQDGTEPQAIVSADSELVKNPHDDLFAPQGIAVDSTAGKVYWSDTVTDTISRANLDGSSVEALVTQGLFSVVGLAVDVEHGKMYWVDRGNNALNGNFDALRRSNLDGSDVEMLVAHGHAEPRGIVVLP